MHDSRCVRRSFAESGIANFMLKATCHVFTVHQVLSDLVRSLNVPEKNVNAIHFARSALSLPI